jgi:hypothetical protein
MDLFTKVEVSQQPKRTDPWLVLQEFTTVRDAGV